MTPTLYTLMRIKRVLKRRDIESRPVIYPASLEFWICFRVSSWIIRKSLNTSGIVIIKKRKKKKKDSSKDLLQKRNETSYSSPRKTSVQESTATVLYPAVFVALLRSFIIRNTNA